MCFIKRQYQTIHWYLVVHCTTGMAENYFKCCVPSAMQRFCILTSLIALTLAQQQPAQTQLDTLKTIERYCPTFMTCDDKRWQNKSTDETNFKFDGYCLDCDCNDDCFLKGNCCHGKKQQNAITSSECVQTFVDYNLSTVFQNSSFILQKSNLEICNEDIQAKCNTPNTFSLIEITPVTSNQTNYRNVFCAICDGHQGAEIQSWQTRISCENTTGSQYLLKRNGEHDFQMLERLSNDFCIIFWVPIYPVETKNCIHTNDVVSTCMPDSDMEFALDKCQSSDSNESLTVPVFQAGSIYKNVFCAFCNCALMPEYTKCPPPSISPVQKTVFTTLLDITTYYSIESPAQCMNFNTVSVLKFANEQYSSLLYKSSIAFCYKLY